MHAYLLIGEENQTKNYGEKLAQKLKAAIIEFPLNRISDTRDLKNITKLTFNTPTAVLINSIDNATEEAGNAFLKNLEEPQENIYYILTASNIKNVLPTIVSRCEMVKITDNQSIVFDREIKKFLELPADGKLKSIDKIKDRGEAKEFVQNLIEISHFNLLNSKNSRVKTVMDLEILLKTLNNLKSNGNVGLQLTYMSINLD